MGTHNTKFKKIIYSVEITNHFAVQLIKEEINLVCVEQRTMFKEIMNCARSILISRDFKVYNIVNRIKYIYVLSKKNLFYS